MSLDELKSHMELAFRCNIRNVRMRSLESFELYLPHIELSNYFASAIHREDCKPHDRSFRE